MLYMSLQESGNSPRLSVSLHPSVAAALEGYMARHNVSATETVRLAISVLAYIDEARLRGVALYADEDGSLHEVIFPA
jgi:hypothetical protein